MNILNLFEEELDYEYQVTKKFIERFPEGKNDYKPHEKSTGLLHLASHIIEVFSWPQDMANTEVLDLATGYHNPPKPETKEDLLQLLEKAYTDGKEALETMDENDLEKKWSLANDGNILASWTKQGAIRHALNQITHHRAQLGVYYRLLDIPLPGSYGPSADDNEF